jgi:hypothetical protein
MGSPHQFDEVIKHLRALYGRFDPDAAALKAWRTMLEPLSDDAMWKGVHDSLADPKCHQWPPTPMMIVANAPKQAGATGGSSIAPCANCAALDGWREMAIRFVLPDGRQDARVVLAACGCALGETRRVAGVLPWREQWARWQGIKARLLADGGEIIGAVYTSERRPLLTDEDRYAPDVLGRLERKPRAAAVALLTEAVRGQDSHAWARERQVERERERDERGWEEAS